MDQKFYFLRDLRRYSRTLLIYVIFVLLFLYYLSCCEIALICESTL